MAIIFQGAATVIIQINLSHYQFDNTLTALAGWLDGWMEDAHSADSEHQDNGTIEIEIEAGSQSILTACKKVWLR